VILLLFVLGLALLLVGAEWLVRGSSRLATGLGLSPLVVGLTVVAFGTSAPELGVTIAAATRGEADLAVGNVVGSNIMNVLLILGISALVAPLVVRRRVIRLDMPILVAVTALVTLLAVDGIIHRGTGALLVAGGLLYTALVVRHARRNRAPDGPGTGAFTAGNPGGASQSRGRRRRVARDLALTLAGLGLLVLGAHWLVESARDIAELLGISQLAIGLTVVAIGTSLPELATSVVASLRGERDIAVGNVIGSNLFNLLIVLGMAAVISHDGVSIAASAARFDFPIMLAVTVACVPIFYTGRGIARWEGAAFLLYFVAYTAYVLLVAGGQDDFPLFRHALLFFALPLMAITMGLCAFRLRQRGNGDFGHCE
jgi:cation:H+ antiporter